MRPTHDLPDDRALPGLAAIRERGLAAIRALAEDDGPVELRLRAHKKGSHATVEARAPHRHVAIKFYASDPSREAELHEELAAAGFAGNSGPRVPPLVTCDRTLRAMVVGWLQGPTIHELIKSDRGERAGHLAASWLRRAASLRVTLGRAASTDHALHQLRKWVGKLEAADPGLGAAAKAVHALLAQTKVKEGAWRLIHGAFHDRNVLDLGDAAGVIDWQRFGQGPAEVEAGMFLASISGQALREPTRAAPAARAKETFLERTADLVDDRALAWHRAASLVRKCERMLKHRKCDWRRRAGALLTEAATHAEWAACHAEWAHEWADGGE